MESLVGALRKKIKGEVITDAATRRRMSHDESVYELMPEMVVEPADPADIEALVSFVLKHKKAFPHLSITPRGGGTNRSGGAIGSSIVLDLTTHLREIGTIGQGSLRAQAGVFLDDLNPLLATKNVQLDSSPLHPHLHTIGGMIANSGQNQTIRQLHVVLGDGKTYIIKPLTKRQLDKKIAEHTYESRLYERIFTLIEAHYDLIKNARPHSLKSTSGYALWNVWDRDEGIFDLTQLFSGSQGTLGIITEATLAVRPRADKSHTVVAYLPSSRHLDEMLKTVMKYSPTLFEGIDDTSFIRGLRRFKKPLSHHHSMHFIMRFEGETEQTVYNTISKLHEDLQRFNVRMRSIHDKPPRAQRALLPFLHQATSHHPTLPLIGDIAVPVQHAATFMAQLKKVLRPYALSVAVYGHFGDGTFHIVPRAHPVHQHNHATIEKILRELIPLVTAYGGTMASEQNDGMALGPWLPVIFDNDIYRIFREVKEIFDPLYIFNPHKKTDATWEFTLSHLRNYHDNHLLK